MTSLMLVEDEASLVEFLCAEEAFALPLVTEIEVGALWRRVARLGVVGVRSIVGICCDDREDSLNREVQERFKYF